SLERPVARGRPAQNASLATGARKRNCESPTLCRGFPFGRRWQLMAFHPFDTVEFHGQLCIVAAVWEADVLYCAIRPWGGGPREYMVPQDQLILVLDVNDFFEQERSGRS